MTDPTRDTVYGIRPHLYPRSEAEDRLARELAESMPLNPLVLAEFGIEACCVEFAETGTSHTEACCERAEAEARR